MASDVDPGAWADGFPVDVGAVRMGDVFDRRRLAELLPGTPGTTHHQRWVAWFETQLERRLARAGKPYTVRYHRGEVQVLDDAGAARHNRKRVRQYFRRGERRHALNLAVDAGLLSPEDRAAHERALRTQGRQFAALRAARRRPEPEPNRRQMPVLPGARE